MEIISCHFKENLGWLEGSPYPVHIVGKEGGDTHRYVGKFSSVNIMPNFAKEAGSYLWHIANNYENLPERMSFIHGHETSGHQKVPIFEAIEEYKEEPFVDLNRFMNFYCLILPDSVYPFRKLWEVLLEPFLGDCPTVINFRGMAQFSVSRDLILSRPKSFWLHLYEKTKLLCQDDSTSFVVACFYEAFWHIILGGESPLADESRPNLVAENGTLILKFHKKPSGYVDVFVDSNGEVYGPWAFMKKIAEQP